MGGGVVAQAESVGIMRATTVLASGRMRFRIIPARAFDTDGTETGDKGENQEGLRGGVGNRRIGSKWNVEVLGSVWRELSRLCLCRPKRGLGLATALEE